MAADTYYDEQGRRRIDRDHSRPDGGQDPASRFAAKLTALEKKQESTDEALQGFTICGPGFSGSGPGGISYDPPNASGGSGSTSGSTISGIAWVVVDPLTSTVDLYIDGTAQGTLGTKLT